MTFAIELALSSLCLLLAADPAEESIAPEARLVASTSSVTRAKQRDETGLFDWRMDKKRKRRSGGGKEVQQAIGAGLEWLEQHQSADGSWKAEGFSSNCGKIGSSVCDGEGSAAHDVGVTGLALLAFLGGGHTSEHGDYQETVRKGVAWLVKQQEPYSGVIGRPSSREYLYGHAIGTLALVEAYYFTKSDALEDTCQDALEAIESAQYPSGGWAYEPFEVEGGKRQGEGEPDSSLTNWMITALATAQAAGLEVDDASIVHAMESIGELTMPDGRTGYRTASSASARLMGINDHYPLDKTETLTAGALLSECLRRWSPKRNPVMVKRADLLLKALPEWDPEGLTNDFYYWYYGTQAMNQLGTVRTKYWKSWIKAMHEALLSHQREDEDERGSWDPIGPWGHAGGRVYTTALGVLCLEAPLRYAPILPKR